MTERPNIVYIMSDDHAAHAISHYGSTINTTPNIDRIGLEGARLDECFCTNSICTPSRASILTGTYSHVNGVRRLADHLEQSQPTVDDVLQGAGYQTAIVGKWHVGHGPNHDPSSFDYWCVLPDQGEYHDPEMIEMGEHKQLRGYVTDIITDRALKWLDNRDHEQPFCLMVHHKAPHRAWEPDAKHATMYDDVDIPTPQTFDDDYSSRATAASDARMRILDDIVDSDTKGPPPPGLNEKELKRWKYQRYIKDYLRCVASIDDNVGRLLDYLDAQGLTDDTVVIYTSDQGFFLGDHGWYDKRFFYEESIRMPFLVRYPREIPAGLVDDHIVLNVDFPLLFIDYGNASAPETMQGTSFRGLLRGEQPSGWREEMYYRYFDYPGDCDIHAHYGIRTKRYKLVCYYEPGPIEWELFDLAKDPHELANVYGDPDYRGVVTELETRLSRLQEELGDSVDSTGAPETAGAKAR